MKLEQQLTSCGWVRAILLKGRQQGCSTYVGGRFYHKTSRQPSKSAFILSHESQSTYHLFSMVTKFHNCLPEVARAEVGTSNVHRLEFKDLLSDYSVGTAGNAEIGRSRTIQYFHGSEVAFWPHTDKLQTGAMQAVALVPGTEVILESTANGMSNMFYRSCMDAIRGKGDYILIFVPWFWQDEYERDVPDGFEMTEEEIEYMGLHLGEFKEDEAKRKLCWRRNKIIELQSEWKFKQEYPATAIEAFQTSGNALIRAEAVSLARKSTYKDMNAPLVLGVDPAREGDRTILLYRRGREVVKYDKYEKMDEMRLAGIIGKVLKQGEVDHCFIDAAYGLGTYDRLKELGFGSLVTPVYFGSRALDPEMYLNKRAEILIAVRDWFHGENVNIPDDDEFHADMMAIPDYKETSNQKKFFEPKAKIKKDVGFSPDIMDALALTFAFLVVKQSQLKRFTKISQGKQSIGRGPLTTMNRVRGVKKQNAHQGYEHPSLRV